MKCLPTRLVGLALVAGMATAGATPLAAQAAGREAVGLTAGQILQEMSDYLGSAEELSFEADVSYDEVSNDQMLQYGGIVQAGLRRPDGLRVQFDGDVRTLEIVFDGRTFTVHDAARNVYATAEQSGSIDHALDTLNDRYGFTVPLADLFYSEPYEALTASVESGRVVGRRVIDGAPCHHLAFSQESIDWQIWVEIGGRPVPRQLVITYKEEAGAPQYIARLSKWSFAPRLSKGWFEFQPPAGADSIDLRPVEDREEGEAP